MPLVKRLLIADSPLIRPYFLGGGIGGLYEV